MKLDKSANHRYHHIGKPLSALLLVFILALLLTACGLESTSALPPASPNSQNTPAAVAQPAESATEPRSGAPYPESAQTDMVVVGGERSDLSDASGSGAPQPTVPQPTATTPPATSGPQIGSEVLFLRDGVLVAHELESSKERQIATSVSEFAATPDGQRLALVRQEEAQPEEIWLVARDGNNLRRVTSNTRTESSLSWAPDGLTLAYASADSTLARPADWISWSRWCATSEVRLLDITSGAETTLEPGCAPAFSNDGQRIAFATPPQDVASGTERMNTPTENNTIRLVNRQGQNGWSFATAEGSGDQSGHLVYSPAWSPDSSQLAYNRFVGYQALVDMSYIEMGGSFEGNGELLGAAAGWLQPPRFSPDGSHIAVVTYDYSNAAGFSGYQIWLTLILEPGEESEVVLPTGTLRASAETVDDMSYATAVAWSPDGSELVVALPPGWQSHDPQEGPAFQNITPAELWRWVPGSAPSEQVAAQVDYASPVLWLPPLR